MTLEKVDTGANCSALSADLTDGFILIEKLNEKSVPEPSEPHLISLYRHNGENPVSKLLLANRKEVDQFLEIAADSRHVDKMGEWIKVAKTAIWGSIVRRFTERVAEDVETGYRLPGIV